MTDAPTKPASNLLLKLHWPSEEGALSGTRYVVVELQDAGGLAVATMLVPSDQLLQAFVRQFDHHPLVTLDGFVSVISDGNSLSQPENRSVALDQLVADAVLPEMLEDEPEATHMLSEFRVRLLKSLEHVEKAIASLSKP